MQVAISGGLGFIGHHIGIKLRELGHEVIAIDNFAFGRKAWHDNRIMTEPYDHLISLPVQNLDSIDKGYTFFNKPDVIVHLASHPNQAAFDADPAEAWANSVTATDTVAAYCARNNVKMVYISSSMVYGNWTGDVREDTPLRPINAYGRMKRYGEQIVQEMVKNYVIIRPISVYGPRDNPHRLIAKWVDAAKLEQPLHVHDPKATLDFTHVYDLVEALSWATLHPVPNEIINVGSGTATTLLDAAELVLKITRSTSEIICGNSVPDGMPRRGALDIRKAVQYLNYKPQWDLTHGLQTV